MSQLPGSSVVRCHEPDGTVRVGGPLPSAILSGSFNPLHRGHITLAAVAGARLGLSVHFELSVANADKAELALPEVERRVAQFTGLAPVWVTHAAIFEQKADIFPGAAFVLGYDTAQLKNPRQSIAAGQKYIGKLLKNGLVRNDLILMATAYNAGAGNLQKWKDELNAKDDALLFMETMPSKETRQFVKRIMAAYWIYQERLDQDTPTLKALAAGGWAKYVDQDSTASASN